MPKIKTKPTPIPIEVRERYIETGEPLQAVFDREFLNIPEFDFYQTEDSGRDWRETKINLETGELFTIYPKDVTPFKKYFQMIKSPSDQPTKILFEIVRKFRAVRDEAKEYEKQLNYKEAARLYEWMVAQLCPMSVAYDRLIMIYKKNRLIDTVLEIIPEAIAHFKDLKARQLKYVGGLAEKYGAMDFFLDRVGTGQKISYFAGVFELYNPYPAIEKWEATLEKLCKKAQVI